MNQQKEKTIEKQEKEIKKLEAVIQALQDDDKSTEDRIAELEKIEKSYSIMQMYLSTETAYN